MDRRALLALPALLLAKMRAKPKVEERTLQITYPLYGKSPMEDVAQGYIRSQSITLIGTPRESG